MRIAIGSDHRGFPAKEKIISQLKARGHEVIDEGTAAVQSVDYPDYAAAVSQKVVGDEADRGILICGTGIGMSIAANKFPQIRAAACFDEVAAEMCRRHNNVNVLCLSGDMLGEKRIERIVEIWLNTEFEEGRHARRLEKITDIEKQLNVQPSDTL
ncbi:MAG: ribose 5-phosphate isomerase B [Pirellulaceae bacterium]|nr:ribose 5-phosphate isomerase B [Pirellulaceae bacterium]